MKKFLKIIDSARFIYFKNRKVRTPVTLEVTDADLKQLHIALRMADIQKFEIITIDESKQEDHVIVSVEENKNVVVEELEDNKSSTDTKENFVIEELDEGVEPSTILEKLMRNEEE